MMGLSARAFFFVSLRLCAKRKRADLAASATPLFKRIIAV
jgi:hypothetical protein